MHTPAFIPTVAPHGFSVLRGQSACAPRRRARRNRPVCQAGAARGATWDDFEHKRDARNEAASEATASASSASSSPGGSGGSGGGGRGGGVQSRWTTAGECDVLLPATGAPQRVVLFVGGFGAGVSAPAFYTNLLARVADAADAAVVAARLPPLPGGDHDALAAAVRKQLGSAAEAAGLRGLPAVALGHSLGARLHVLEAAADADTADAARDAYPELDARRMRVRGVALMAFSNAPAPRDMMPALGRLPDVLDRASDGVAAGLRDAAAAFAGMADDYGYGGGGGAAADAVGRGGAAVRSVLRGAAESLRRGVAGDVTPDPTASLARARRVQGPVLVVRFERDSLDDGDALLSVLREVGDVRVVERALDGTHITPVSPSFEDREFGMDADGAGDGIGDEIGRRARRAAADVDEEMRRLVEVVAAFVCAVAN